VGVGCVGGRGCGGTASMCCSRCTTMCRTWTLCASLSATWTSCVSWACKRSAGTRSSNRPSSAFGKRYSRPCDIRVDGPGAHAHRHLHGPAWNAVDPAAWVLMMWVRGRRWCCCRRPTICLLCCRRRSTLCTTSPLRHTRSRSPVLATCWKGVWAHGEAGRMRILTCPWTRRRYKRAYDLLKQKGRADALLFPGPDRCVSSPRFVCVALGSRR
jgi:hypothetical protein